MKRTLIPLLVAGAGGAILLWAAIAMRGDAEASPKLRRTARAEAPRPAVEATAPRADAPRPPASPSAAPAGSLDLSVLKARIEAMEARVRELEARRDLLKTDNERLSGEIAEKSADARARSTAEWRVRSLAKTLSLTELQQDEIRTLWTRWAREDQSGRASASTWLAREGELRARLSAEQSLELHDSAVAQISRDWSNMGRKLGSVAGAPAEEHGRLQQSIGNAPVPDTALLREAHGADWPGLMRVAAERMRPMLTPEQGSNLDRFASRYAGGSK